MTRSTKKNIPTVAKPILSSDFNADKLKFTLMKKSTNLHSSYVNYGDCETVAIMTPLFEITTGGIFPENDKGYDRNFISVPLDNNPDFEKLLESIDEAVIKNSETIFGSFVNLSTKKHIPLVKSNLFKTKLRIDFNSKNVLTRVFVKGKPINSDEIKSVDDVAKYVTYGSKIQMVIMVDKVWAKNSVFDLVDDSPLEFGKLAEANTTVDAMYGVSLVVLQVNVVEEKKPSQKSKTLDAYYKSNEFGQ